MDKDEIINRLIDSDVNRPIEIVFLDDAFNFSRLTRYLAALRYIGENDFYIILPVIDNLKALLDDDLKGQNITIPSLDTDFEITFSFYRQNLGHVLGISNSGVNLRRFPRVPFDMKVYLSINKGGEQGREEIEVYALNLSGSGIAIRHHRTATPTNGLQCQLRIPNSDFPGYDSVQGVAGTRFDPEVVETFIDQVTQSR